MRKPLLALSLFFGVAFSFIAFFVVNFVHAQNTESTVADGFINKASTTPRVALTPEERDRRQCELNRMESELRSFRVESHEPS